MIHGRILYGGQGGALCPCTEIGLQKYIRERCLNEVGQARQGFDACRTLSLY